MKQTVVKNTIWLFIGEFGIRFLKLFIFIYAARKLGTSEWGIFSYSLAIMSLFAIISDIGINAVLIRETAKKNNQIKEYLSTSFFLKIGLSFISGFLLLSLLFFLKDTNALKMLIPITALMLFFDKIKEFGFAFNRAHEKMEVEAIIKLITTGILVILGCIFITQDPKAISLSYAYVIAGFFGVFITYFYLRKYFTHIFYNFKKTLIIPIFKEAWPIATVAILGTLMANIDTIILGLYWNTHEIGLYSAAQKPIQIIYLIPVLLGTAILPVFSRLAEKKEINQLIKKTMLISLILILPIIILIIILGKPIFILLFGVQYIKSIPVFKIMTLALLASAPGAIVGNAMFATGKQKKLLQFIAIGIILDIILCFLLIPKFGILGAGISITTAQIFGNIFLLLNAKKMFLLKFSLNKKELLEAIKF